MTAELWLRDFCPECGRIHSKNTWGYIYPEVCNGPGGSEERLDPERVLTVWPGDGTIGYDLTAQHILDALGATDEAHP